MTFAKINKEYTIDEIQEGLKTTDLPEPYQYQAKIGAPVLFVPTGGKNAIQIQVGKKKLTLVDTLEPKDSVGASMKNAAGEVLKDSALDALTGGWNSILKNNPNKALEKQIAAECTRLFGS